MLGDKEMATTTQKELHTTIERGEDGYFIASVVELPGCHIQAKSLKKLDKRIREVIELYSEVEGKDMTTPEFIALKKVRV